MNRYSTIKFIFGLILTVGVISLYFQPDSTALAIGSFQDGVMSARGDGQPADLFGANGVFTTVANTLLYIVGALSVVMIIYGGLRYVISGGNSSAVTAAKNTILYAIVGLIISVLSYAIINFLLSTLMTSGGGGGGAGWSNI